MTQASYMLCLDAATMHLTLALGRLDPTPLLLASLVSYDKDRQNSSRIDGAIIELCDKVGIAPQQIDRIACGVGPGTFTGTRVAVSLAKGLALALDLPVFPVSTLRALCPSEATGPGLAVLDARRGEVYAALYSPSGRPPCDWTCQLDPVCTTPERLVQLVEERSAKAPAWIAGTGLGPIESLFPTSQALHPHILASGLWSAGQSAKHAVSAHELSVHYLRASYAEIGANPPKKPPYRSPFV